MESMSKVTVPQIRQRKTDGQKISVVTAYDYPSAQLIDAAGVDMILVGDSLGNVVQGKSTTLPVTVGEMIYHAEMVVRAAKNALVVVDLPFPYCQLGPKEAVKTAAKILKNTLADAVKIEGGDNRYKTIKAVVDAGIPVMGHCGLQPQKIKMLGHFSLQRNQEQLQKDIDAIENAGAFAAVLECVSPEIAEEVTRSVKIPTIGIGAGPHCDGQVLVYHDLLGFKETAPKHVRVYANLGQIITEAVRKYCEEVREGTFLNER